MDFEDVLEEIGSFDHFHKRFFVMLFLAGVPNAFPMIMFVYTQYEQDFHCAAPDWIRLSKNSSEYEQLLDSIIPWQNASSGVVKRSQCKMYDIDFSNTSHASLSFTNHKNVTSCKYGYEFETMNTAVAEFDLVCEESWKPPFVIVLYMISVGAASFSGYFSDKYGRRPLFLIFTFAQFLFTGLLSVSWNYTSYAALVMLVGFTGMVNYVVAFVLAIEMVKPKHQLPTALFIFSSYTFGYITTPLFGYIFPNWRWFLRAISSTGVLYIPMIWYFPESLRLHMVRKKEKPAKTLMKKIAHENGKTIDADKIYDLFQKFQNDKKKDLKKRRNSLIGNKESSFFLQCFIPTMGKRYLASCFSWFVASLVYFAISLNPTMLSGDRLVNIFLSGLAEIPGLGIAYYMPRAIGRVRSASLLYLLCGVSCVAAPFLRRVDTVLMTILVMLSKITIVSAYDIIYLVTAEISPTLVRNTSMGISSLCARIGGIAMPFLIMTGDESNLVPCLAMGIISTLCGISYLFVMPETGGVVMPDSTKMAMKNNRIYGFKVWRKFSKLDEVDSASIEKEITESILT